MTSKEQFKALFAEHEPQLLKNLEDFIEVFGRENCTKLKIWCPLPEGKRKPAEDGAV